MTVKIEIHCATVNKMYIINLTFEFEFHGPNSNITVFGKSGPLRINWTVSSTESEWSNIKH